MKKKGTDVLCSGNEAPFYMIGYFVLSGVLLRAFSPPFGRCKLSFFSNSADKNEI
jgi:hypothetical protein